MKRRTLITCFQLLSLSALFYLCFRAGVGQHKREAIVTFSALNGGWAFTVNDLDVSGEALRYTYQKVSRHDKEARRTGTLWSCSLADGTYRICSSDKGSSYSEFYIRLDSTSGKTLIQTEDTSGAVMLCTNKKYVKELAALLRENRGWDVEEAERVAHAALPGAQPLHGSVEMPGNEALLIITPIKYLQFAPEPFLYVSVSYRG